MPRHILKNESMEPWVAALMWFISNEVNGKCTWIVHVSMKKVFLLSWNLKEENECKRTATMAYRYENKEWNKNVKIFLPSKFCNVSPFTKPFTQLL